MRILPGNRHDHPRDRRRLIMDKSPGSSPIDAELSKEAQQQLKKAEAGDPAAVRKIDAVRTASPAAADAAEQEASDGPEGLGLAR
jgi:hypothetical protein